MRLPIISTAGILLTVFGKNSQHFIMSGIDGFQIFNQQRNQAGSAVIATVPVPYIDAANLSMQPDSSCPSSQSVMHMEATQPEIEDTQSGSMNSTAMRRAASTAIDAWGLLRRQSSDREEFTLIHRIKDFKRDTFTIGRSSKCDVTVADSWVSTNHCCIYCDYTQPKMRVFIEDSSVNGTFINNALTRLRKGERVELRSGDEIYLLNPRKPENAAKAFTSFVFINLRERLMAFREISVAPSLATSVVPNSSAARQALAAVAVVPPTASTSSGRVGAEALAGAAAGNGIPQQQRLQQQPLQSLLSTQQQQHQQVAVRHIEEKYIIGDQIGSGMSGQVYACVNKQTSEHCAVKIIDTRKFSLNPGR